jgi:hypothetical protein
MTRKCITFPNAHSHEQRQYPDFEYIKFVKKKAPKKACMLKKKEKINKKSIF